MKRWALGAAVVLGLAIAFVDVTFHLHDKALKILTGSVVFAGSLIGVSVAAAALFVIAGGWKSHPLFTLSIILFPGATGTLTGIWLLLPSGYAENETVLTSVSLMTVLCAPGGVILWPIAIRRELPKSERN